MKRFLAASAVCLLLAGCATTGPQRVEMTAKPEHRILLVKPDVELSLLTASGAQEARDDWNQAAISHISASLAKRLSKHPLQQLDPVEAMGGRGGQLLRLNDAVAQTISVYTGPVKLPTKTSEFNWTLGEGAQVLGQKYNADYALFIVGRGSYSSGGRVAAAVLMSAVGVGIPLGVQGEKASLVDLKTGRVVWFNQTTGGDLRTEEGIKLVLDKLLKDAPL